MKVKYYSISDRFNTLLDFVFTMVEIELYVYEMYICAPHVKGYFNVQNALLYICQVRFYVGLPNITIFNSLFLLSLNIL